MNNIIISRLTSNDCITVNILVIHLILALRGISGNNLSKECATINKKKVIIMISFVILHHLRLALYLCQLNTKCASPLLINTLSACREKLTIRFSFNKENTQHPTQASPEATELLTFSICPTRAKQQ